MKVRDFLIAGAALALPIAAAQAVPPASSGTTTSGSSPVNPGASTATSPAAVQSTTQGATTPQNSDVAQGAGVTSGAGNINQSAGASATAGGSGGATANAVQPVTAADVTKGAQVFDTSGGSVGTIDSTTADGAVISTGKVRAQVPLTGLGKTDKGLVLGMTKAQLEAAAGAASASKGSQGS